MAFFSSKKIFKGRKRSPAVHEVPNIGTSPIYELPDAIAPASDPPVENNEAYGKVVPPSYN